MRFDKILLSGVMFALALRVSSILHEGAHALVAWLYGVEITISSWTVHGDAPARVAVAMAAAGPLYSLLQGVGGLLVLRAVDGRPSALRLLLIWLSLHGLSAGFGYFLTAFAGKGDVALICRLLGVGSVGRAVFVLLGAAGVLWTGRCCVTLLMPFAEAELALPERRAQLLLELAVLPWLLATGIALAFAWPFSNLFGLFYELASGAFTFAAYRFARRAAAPAVTHGWPEVTLWPWIALTGLVMLVSRVTIGGSS
jgi:hypothetical protein